jgi:hypothetical protein
MTEPEFEFPQGIYHRGEIPVADYFMSLREPLIKEFMRGFNTLEKAIKTRGTNNLDRQHMGVAIDRLYNVIRTLDPESQEYKNNFDAWKSIGFRYECHDPETIPDINWTMEENHIYAKLYPTAYGLVKKYGKYCPIANYSVMAPNSVLVRHTGPENRHGKYVRIHIPLIIPEGDIFLEVNGEEVNWSDIFAFNNQLAHSSHNYSSEYRLIFLIDLDREFLGMPPGSVYDERLEKYAKPFLRNGEEWHLY